ncbi:COG2426 family protein [Chloroflexota bacterium]
MNPDEALWVFLIAAAPIVELRLAIPVAMVTYDMAWYSAFPICVAGNLLPVPFLLRFLGPVSEFLSKIKLFERLINWVFKRTRRRSNLVEKYGWLGLIMVVAVPLPGTGAWTGSILAFLLGMRFKPAFLSILCGVLIAGVIVTILSHMGIFFLGSDPE